MVVEESLELVAALAGARGGLLCSGGGALQVCDLRCRSTRLVKMYDDWWRMYVLMVVEEPLELVAAFGGARGGLLGGSGGALQVCDLVTGAYRLFKGLETERVLCCLQRMLPCGCPDMRQGGDSRHRVLN